jgi:hypothetical protein
MTYDRAKRSVCRAMRDVLRKNSLYNKFYELQRLHAVAWTEKITMIPQGFCVKRRFEGINYSKLFFVFGREW